MVICPEEDADWEFACFLLLVLLVLHNSAERGFPAGEFYFLEFEFYKMSSLCVSI
jgi:hypothetical protein